MIRHHRDPEYINPGPDHSPCASCGFGVSVDEAIIFSGSAYHEDCLSLAGIFQSELDLKEIWAICDVRLRNLNRWNEDLLSQLRRAQARVEEQRTSLRTVWLLFLSLLGCGLVVFYLVVRV